MTHYLVGIHNHDIHDSTIVELYSGEQHDPPTSIVARVEELKRLGYWKVGEKWNYAKGERKAAAERGGVPQWKPVANEAQPDDAKPEPRPRPRPRPFIDDSDPNNPIFSYAIGQYETAFSIKYVPEEYQLSLAILVAESIERAYITGKKEARAEMQAAIRNALML